jgi:dTDP-4-dehydrorhamnose reductase
MPEPGGKLLMPGTLTKPIVVLGAGLLGKELAAQCDQRRQAVILLDRASCGLTSADEVAAVLGRSLPGAVINCAAYTKVDRAEVERDAAMAVNAVGAANVARACAMHHIRLVHISTDFVFDGTANTPYQPADKTNPLSVYGQSKLQGELLIREINPAGWFILRTSWLFGMTGPCFPRAILDRAMKGQPLKIVNDQVGSPTYAPDLAAATLDLIDRKASGIHHLANGGQCSWFEFATAIAAEFGIVADIQPTTTAAFREARPGQAVRPAYSVMADAQIPELLGRKIRPWQEALASYRAAWSEDGSS